MLESTSLVQQDVQHDWAMQEARSLSFVLLCIASYRSQTEATSGAEPRWVNTEGA